jgi:hypothetical protein
MKHILYKRKNNGKKTRRNLESEKTRVYAQKPRLRTLFKNSIPGVAAPQLLLQGLLDHGPQAVRETLVQPAYTTHSALLSFRCQLSVFRIQHFLLNTDRDPIWIQCLDDQKLKNIYS